MDLNGVAAIFLVVMLFGIPVLTLLSGGNPWGSRNDSTSDYHWWNRDH